MSVTLARPVAALLGLLVLTLGAGTGTVASPATAGDLPRHAPERLAGLGTSTQVVVVTSHRRGTSHARLRAYEKLADGSWSLVAGPVEARIGRNGWWPAATRRQGSGTTPAGVFRLRTAFGTEPNPGTALPYRQVDRNDWWPYDPRDPATYNVLQTLRSSASGWRTSWAEDLSGYGRQYRHAVVVGFNLPGGVHRVGDEQVAARQADTRRGGGIFLHVLKRPGLDRSTTGCVAVSEHELTALMRWLEPAARPRIVMGPLADLDQVG